ncbi:MAG: hypothetical protein IT384_05925 [Deltaproteobacteria bacterium]|nr:hypothetical protein [Deltaproteobacteria bacterium]
MASPSLAAAGVFMSACGVPTVWLPPADARSVILAARGEGGGWQLEALEPREGRSVWSPSAPPERVVALFYDAPLISLRLFPGPLHADAERGMQLPRPARAMSLDLGGDSSSWTLGEPPPDLLAIRVAPGWACSVLDTTRLTLPGTWGETVALAVPLGSSEVLIATTEGRFFRVDTATVSRLDLDPSTPHLAGFGDPRTGELWLLGRDGRVVRGRPESGFHAAPSLPPGVGAPWGVAGSRGAAPFELYAVTSSHALLHSQGDSWQIIQPARGLDWRYTRAPIAWSEPGAAVALGVGDLELDEIAGDRVTAGTVILALANDVLTSLWHLDRWGVLLGSGRGHVLERSGNAWQSIVKSDAFFDNVVMGEARGALVFGGEEGILNEYVEGTGLCPAQVVSPHHAYFMVPMEDGLLLVSAQTGVELEAIRIELAPSSR